jgi:soluble lytic murein transglycosylase-like protein
VRVWLLSPLYLLAVLIVPLVACVPDEPPAAPPDPLAIEPPVVEPATPVQTPQPTPAAHPEPMPQTPRLARVHQRDLTILAQREFGLGAPVALMAGQVHQESAWREDVATGLVRSSVGAQGLTQFMPSTAAWISERYPDLGAAEPFDPVWSLRAMVRYNRHLYDRSRGHTECDKWWWTLRAYNGGEGHLRTEGANATDIEDRHALAAACGTARRSATHCPENLGYPQRITERWEPIYLRAGWRGEATCTG